METAIAQAQNAYQIQPYADKDSFELAQRMATSLTKSTLLPAEFQGEKGLGNCLIAMEMAGRMRISPFMCIQNLYVVKGRPSWSAQFVISLINTSGRFKGNLRYRYSEDGNSCTAYAIDNETGETLEGETISIEMAKKAGWYEKGNSLWQSSPRQMLAYRAATFFARLHCPDVILGMYTREEIIDATLDEGETHSTPSPSRIRGDASGKAKRIADDILGAPEPVIDATLMPESESEPELVAAPAPAPKIEKPATPAPHAKPIKDEAREKRIDAVFADYTNYFRNDPSKGREVIASTTSGRKTKDWTDNDIDALEIYLSELKAKDGMESANNATLSQGDTYGPFDGDPAIVDEESAFL
ncbi:MAG: recombinase RecT [Synergistaceae bacterium]|jgi:hypothetical protein|nr:recombinase RecT [Synergistaceae bacterium]